MFCRCLAQRSWICCLKMRGTNSKRETPKDGVSGMLFLMMVLFVYYRFRNTHWIIGSWVRSEIPRLDFCGARLALRGMHKLEKKTC